MTRVGFVLPVDAHEPRRLVRLAGEAEQAGFDLLQIGDRLRSGAGRPNAPFAWSLLGGIALLTVRAEVVVGPVTPDRGLDPLALAQAVATSEQLMPRRVALALGSVPDRVATNATSPQDPPRSVDRMVEWVGVLARALSGEQVPGDDAVDERVPRAVRGRSMAPMGARPVPLHLFGTEPEVALAAAEMGAGLWLVPRGGWQSSVRQYREAGGPGPITLSVRARADDDHRLQTMVSTGWPGADRVLVRPVGGPVEGFLDWWAECVAPGLPRGGSEAAVPTDRAAPATRDRRVDTDTDTTLTRVAAELARLLGDGPTGDDDRSEVSIDLAAHRHDGADFGLGDPGPLPERELSAAITELFTSSQIDS